MRRAGPPFSNPWQPHPLLFIPITDVEHSWDAAPSCSPVLRSYAKHPSPGNLDYHSPQCSLLSRSTNCGELDRSAKPQQQRPCTQQPTEPADRPQITSSIGHHSWPRCRTACAKATATEHTSASTSTAIRQLKNNKSPGVCITLAEMLKEGGDDVHLALHRLFLGIWRAEAAPNHFKQDILITIALQSIAPKAYAMKVKTVAPKADFERTHLGRPRVEMSLQVWSCSFCLEVSFSTSLSAP